MKQEATEATESERTMLRRLHRMQATARVFLSSAPSAKSAVKVPDRQIAFGHTFDRRVRGRRTPATNEPTLSASIRVHPWLNAREAVRKRLRLSALEMIRGCSLGYTESRVPWVSACSECSVGPNPDSSHSEIIPRPVCRTRLLRLPRLSRLTRLPRLPRLPRSARFSSFPAPRGATFRGLHAPHRHAAP